MKYLVKGMPDQIVKGTEDQIIEIPDPIPPIIYDDAWIKNELDDIKKKLEGIENILGILTKATDENLQRIQKLENVPPPVVVPPVVTPPSSVDGLFKVANIWNTPLSPSASIRTLSPALVTEFMKNCTALPGVISPPWINYSQFSTPLYVVKTDIPKVVINLIAKPGELASQPWLPDWLKKSALQAELNKGFRIPAGALPARGTDMHMTVYDEIDDTLLELWLYTKEGANTARWGGIIKGFSKSQGMMAKQPNGERWGATATGCPIICGQIMKADLDKGILPYLLGAIITFPSNKWVPPAIDSDGYNGKPAWVNPPLSWIPTIEEGTRLRLPASFVVPAGISPLERMILTAIRDYGMIIRDKGGCFALFAQDIDLKPYMAGKDLTQTMKTIVSYFPQLQVLA